jgi:UDP:flavonoid glycosyltransferase YjiC (YdhE family)
VITSGGGDLAPARTGLRIFLGAFGDPGHAFPMLALGSELARRGHEVTFETWTRWRQHVEDSGMRFLPAPEYPVFPTRERPLQPYEAVVLASAQTRRSMSQRPPDVVIHDILTLAPALAAELEGVPTGTLVPHVYPVGSPGFPPYALGARLPRTGLGRALWRTFDWPVQLGLRRGRAELNEARTKLGLPPVDRLHGGLSERLVIVGTFPQLEYPREWPPEVHVVGPLMWEPPFGEVAAPVGSAPLVVVAPSTAQDPQQRLLRAALDALAGEPVRVLATWNRRPPPVTLAAPPNTRLVEWISYSRTMPGSALVICHGGHGTLVRALASGVPVLAVPHSGDMAENAARAQWAGVGIRLPWRLLGTRSLRAAVRLALAERSLVQEAAELSAWAAANDAVARACDLVEELARQGSGGKAVPGGDRFSRPDASARTR